MKRSKFQGLEDEDIVYLSEEESDLVDGLPTKSRIKESILQLGDSEKEAIEHVLIYLVDHGGEGVFKLNESTLLEAQELGEWIDEMHSRFDGKIHACLWTPANLVLSCNFGFGRSRE